MGKVVIMDHERTREYQLPTYGSLTITTQNGKVVFVERTDKTKIN